MKTVDIADITDVRDWLDYAGTENSSNAALLERVERLEKMVAALIMALGIKEGKKNNVTESRDAGAPKNTMSWK